MSRCPFCGEQMCPHDKHYDCPECREAGVPLPSGYPNKGVGRDNPLSREQR